MGFPNYCDPPDDSGLVPEYVDVNRLTGGLTEFNVRKDWVFLLDTTPNTPEDTPGGAFGGKNKFFLLPADCAVQKGGGESSIFSFFACCLFTTVVCFSTHC